MLSIKSNLIKNKSCASGFVGRADEQQWTVKFLAIENLVLFTLIRYFFVNLLFLNYSEP